MRRVGGFFIRRKIDDGNDKDYVYRAVLHSVRAQMIMFNPKILSNAIKCCAAVLCELFAYLLFRVA